jgi:hypothetical protein
MRISKFWSAACAAAFLAGFHTVRAQDNPAQAAARAALMEKLNKPNVQPSSATNMPAAPTTPRIVAAPVAPAPPPSATASAPASTGDTPAQAAARAALMGKINDLNAQPTPPANPNLAPIVITPTGAAAEPPPRVQSQPTPALISSATPSVTAGAGDTPAQTAARAALMEKMSQLNAQQNQPANSTAQPRRCQANDSGSRGGKEADQPA